MVLASSPSFGNTTYTIEHVFYSRTPCIMKDRRMLERLLFSLHLTKKSGSVNILGFVSGVFCEILCQIQRKTATNLTSLLCHPPISPPRYLSKHKYILTLMDDYSRFLQVYTIKSKNEVTENLELGLGTFRSMFPKNKMRFFRCDNGTEFLNKDVETILQTYKIKLDTSAPYAHEHNGLILISN